MQEKQKRKNEERGTTANYSEEEVGEAGKNGRKKWGAKAVSVYK